MVQYSGSLLNRICRSCPCILIAALVAVLTTILPACTGRNGKSFLPDIPGYNSSAKQVYILHKHLLEISGITYINDRTLAAINDEDGKVFTVDFSDHKPASVKFGDKKDYEDIVYADSLYYVLESNGNIHVVPVANPGDSRKVQFHKKRKIEFESLYKDERTGKLVLLSKEQRLIDEALVAYSFDPLTEMFSNDPYYIIPLRDVKRLMKDYSVECKPSAAAVHPKFNKLFVIASVGKVLLICTLDGIVEKAYSLNPDLFAQPEGICFAPNGDMFISNEGLQGKATIIKFPYTGP